MSRWRPASTRFAAPRWAESREAAGVGHHAGPAEGDAEERAELRPQRFGVAHPPQVAPDRGGAPRLLVAREFVVRPAGGERLPDVLGGEHAREHRVVRALDARHVDETGRAADERAARKREFRHRLPAALRDGARAVADALAARESVAHQRVRLEALEFLERREIGIGVVEVEDEADRYEGIAIVIEKRAAAGRIVERPAHGVLHQTGAMLVRRDLPQLLQSD